MVARAAALPFSLQFRFFPGRVSVRSSLLGHPIHTRGSAHSRKTLQGRGRTERSRHSVALKRCSGRSRSDIVFVACYFFALFGRSSRIHTSKQPASKSIPTGKGLVDRVRQIRGDTIFSAVLSTVRLFGCQPTPPSTFPIRLQVRVSIRQRQSLLLPLRRGAAHRSLGRQREREVLLWPRGSPFSVPSVRPAPSSLTSKQQ